MIIGTGIDLIQVDRIKRAAERWNDKFLSRIYTPQEINYCRGKRQEYVHFAARFAAKEAVRKALGERMSWKEVEITNGCLGKPEVKLTGRAGKIGRRQGAKEIFLSLSHDHSYAIAQAVIVKDSETTEAQRIQS